MRVSLIGYGTRGDVQPVLILADALRNRGHQVRVLAGTDAAPLLERAGLEHQAIPVDVRAVFSDPTGQAMLARGDIMSFFKWLNGIEREQAAGIRRAIVDGCFDADLVVSDALMLDRAAAAAQARGVPLVPLSAYPLLPTREFADPFITTRRLGPLNMLTHRLLLGMLWKNSHADVNLMRRELGVPTASRGYIDEVMRQRLPYLLAYSPRLAPRPADWHAAVQVIGTLRFPAALRERIGENLVPPALVDWVNAGPPPIYFGMGSMPVRDPAPMLATLRQVLTRTGQRAVVAAGWSDPAGMSDAQMQVAGTVDHDWLMPRCCAAVHHGGAGTVYASLAAGLPTVVCSVFADQPYWRARVKALGVGATLPFKHFGMLPLCQALQQVLSPAVAEAARSLGEQLRTEDGLPQAVARVESFASKDEPTAPAAA